MAELLLAEPESAASHPYSLIDAIRHWARKRPHDFACTFVDYGRHRDGLAHTWTYAELDAHARAIAQRVRETADPGDRVLLALPQGLSYIAAFVGCLYAGVISVPLYAPHLLVSSGRLVSVAHDCAPAVTLTDTASVANLGELVEERRADLGRIIACDTIEPGPDFTPDRPDANTVAYLQYTSGSTRRPAGVMVTHGNLWSQAEQVSAFSGLAPGEALAAWTPFFHDMGLLLAVVHALRCGAHGVYLAPHAFVQRPRRWVQLLSDYRAVATATPNFGLDRAVQAFSVQQHTEFDLSALRLVLVGAEPIRPESVTAFTETYREHGLDPRAFSGGWGLAEAGCLVTGVPLSEHTPIRWFDRTELGAGRVRETEPHASGATAQVGCGVPWQQDVIVVDPDTCAPLPEGQVGELWVHGPNVCAGYYRRPAESAEVFDARPVPPPELVHDDPTYPARGWLRTGDLGFVHRGSVYVTSRLKDVVIVNGANHSPFDLEATVAEALPQLRPWHVAAFQVDEPGTGGLVIVGEIEAGRIKALDAEAAITRVRQAIGRDHSIDVFDVVLTRPGKIPKTSSGKIQRRACRDRYLTGFDTVVAAFRDTAG
ncbi:fatty acyl-AMP ligase [Salinactinospora qingdaonensis]